MIQWEKMTITLEAELKNPWKYIGFVCFFYIRLITKGYHSCALSVALNKPFRALKEDHLSSSKT